MAEEPTTLRSAESEAEEPARIRAKIVAIEEEVVLEDGRQSKPFKVYVVEVQSEGRVWRCNRRYRQFYSLYTKINPKLPKEHQVSYDYKFSS